MNKEKFKDITKEVATLVLVIILSIFCITCWNNSRLDVDVPVEYDTDTNLNL